MLCQYSLKWLLSVMYEKSFVDINKCYKYKEKEKGGSKVRVLGQEGACNSAPNGPNDLKFCMLELLWVTIEFWSSQGHVTSIEADHIWRPEQVWPLERSHDIDLNKTK